MINRLYAVFSAGVLALAIAVGCLNAQPQAQAPLRIPQSVLERYVGDYDQSGSTIKVRLEGDKLVQEASGQRLALVPISETEFRIGAIFTAKFVTDQAGGMTQVLSDGVEFEARLPRKGSRTERQPAPPVETVRVPRSTLERYVGTYEFLPGQMGRTDLSFTVRLKGDTLVRSMQYEAVLTPISETRFRVGDSSLVTEFVIDEAGVTQVMGTGFQQLLARLKPKH